MFRQEIRAFMDNFDLKTLKELNPIVSLDERKKQHDEFLAENERNEAEAAAER